jgi:translation initiation factor IF-2
VAARPTAAAGHAAAAVLPLPRGRDVWQTPRARQRVVPGQWPRAARPCATAPAADRPGAQSQQWGRDARGVAQHARTAWRQAAQSCEAAGPTDGAARGASGRSPSCGQTGSGPSGRGRQSSGGRLPSRCEGQRGTRDDAYAVRRGHGQLWRGGLRHCPRPAKPRGGVRPVPASGPGGKRGRPRRGHHALAWPRWWGWSRPWGSVSGPRGRRPRRVARRGSTAGSGPGVRGKASTGWGAGRRRGIVPAATVCWLSTASLGIVAPCVMASAQGLGQMRDWG